MRKKSDFKTSKVRWLKPSYEYLYKRNSLIFCAFVLLICSAVVRFIDSFAEGMRDLFFTYAKIQQQVKTDEIICENPFNQCHLCA